MIIRDFQKMYCINLPRRADRRQHAQLVFKNFNFSYHFVKLFEMELLDELYKSFNQINEDNVIYNMLLDFSYNTKYMSNLQLVESKHKNFYKSINFNK